MGQVIIRNIEDRVLERLKGRAASQHKSLEQSLRDLLTEAAKPHPADLLAEAERIRAMSKPDKNARFPTAEELIREARDSR
jgi:plasmid stability protein